MKTKSKLVLGLSILGAATLAAGTTSTFAWYTVAQAAGMSKSTSALSGLAVQGNQQNLNGIKFVIAPKGSPATTLSITNRTGKTYYRVGDKFTEILDGDTGTTLGAEKKQASMEFSVKIIEKNSDPEKAPSVEALASVAGTYVITASATGQAKIDINQTKALGTDAATPVYNFGDTGVTKAGGALGAAKNASVEIMQITISNTGVVSYKNAARTSEVATVTDGHTVWETTGHEVANNSLATAWDTSVIYYGLEVESDAAQADNAQTLSASTIGVSIAGTLLGGGDASISNS